MQRILHFDAKVTISDYKKYYLHGLKTILFPYPCALISKKIKKLS